MPPMARVRRFHLNLRPITVIAAGHRVTFVGATFHNRSVMIEYDVDPPLHRSADPFGPTLLTLVATDDVETEPYPTHWEDFDWSISRPGRMTTRLDRRPPTHATRLNLSVRTPHRQNEPNGRGATVQNTDRARARSPIGLRAVQLSRPIRQRTKRRISRPARPTQFVAAFTTSIVSPPRPRADRWLDRAVLPVILLVASVRSWPLWS